MWAFVQSSHYFCVLSVKVILEKYRIKKYLYKVLRRQFKIGSQSESNIWVFCSHSNDRLSMHGRLKKSIKKLYQELDTFYQSSNHNSLYSICFWSALISGVYEINLKLK